MLNLRLYDDGCEDRNGVAKNEFRYQLRFIPSKKEITSISNNELK